MVRGCLIKCQGTEELDELARVDEEPPAQGEQPEDAGTTPHLHYQADCQDCHETLCSAP